MSSPESLLKRRGSPSLLASEEPNPKRTGVSCADSSSLVTQLFNDKFIQGLACVLAEDEKIVGMAEKLLEDAKSEHGTIDLDAWKYFTSLPIWEYDKFMQQYPTKMGPKQEHLNQQIQETKACISDEPSLKPLFAEKEHIRVVLILVILFWSRDVDGIPCWFLMGFLDERVEPPTEWCCIPIDHLRMSLPSEDEMKKMGNLADELMNNQFFLEKKQELLGTVHRFSPQGALEHLDKVKEVWGNHRFLDHLLKFEFGPMLKAQRISNIRLSIYIGSLIKKDPLFEVISGYGDPDFRMRVALSILIGFWSNQDMIHPLVYTMGGDALGVKKEQSGEGKQESPRDWMSNTPSIIEFYRDKSILELAVQLKDEPEAVNCVDVFLDTLSEDCLCSYEDFFNAASTFWYKPSIVLKLNEAMKKDPQLAEILTKYSKGAETLRAQERMIHIRKDFPLDVIDSNDSNKMRLALNILLVYWGDRDLTQLFQSLQFVKKRIGKVFDFGEKDDEIALFYYYARCATDVEGLKRWLANKYGEKSDKALSLAKKIGKYQMDKGKEAEKRGYSGGPLDIQLVLNKSSILTFSLSWFLKTGQFKQLVVEQIPFGCL